MVLQCTLLSSEMVLMCEQARVELLDTWSKWEGMAAQVVLTWEGGLELQCVLLWCKREPALATANINGLERQGAPWHIYLLGLQAVVGSASRALSGPSFVYKVDLTWSLRRDFWADMCECHCRDRHCMHTQDTKTTNNNPKTGYSANSWGWSWWIWTGTTYL